MRLFKLIILTIFFTTCLFITACNTTKGVGQDLEAAGEAIEKKAKEKGAEG